MKILDKYLLKTFLITFTTVFVILFFIFILQTVWLFISELTGKGLDFFMVVKFLLFAMPRLIPLVLPLSVLLASIMTFGDLSENYEFAAMKSSGISLQRAMQSLTVFILILSVISFIFANNVIPYAEYKFTNFRRNIAQIKPAMAIAEGQFSEIGNYTIKVEKKSGKDGNFLTGVTIHKKSPNGEGNTTVIKAEKGELVSSESSNVLKLVLTNGYYYEDVIPTKFEERIKMPFAKATFKSDVINIDLSKLNDPNSNVDIAHTDAMLNMNELRFTIDSLKKDYKKSIVSNTENIYQRTGIGSPYNQYVKDTLKPIVFKGDLLKDCDNLKKLSILKIALSNIENTGFTIDSSILETENKQKNINSHYISLYDKFMIAFSCIMMFFIGAPLGAIIRKGGLGLPIVFAITIFIIFHFVNTFGKRVAQENGISPFMGTWMSSMILTPLAVFLTYRAINDIGGMINTDAIIESFQKFVKKIIPEKYLDSSTKIFDINWFNSSVEIIKKLNLVALVFNVISIISIGLAVQSFSKPKIIIGVIGIILMYVSIILSHKKQNKIGEIIGKEFDPNLIVSLILAFPFYFLVYFLNLKTLNKLEFIPKITNENDAINSVEKSENHIIEKMKSLSIVALIFNIISIVLGIILAKDYSIILLVIFIISLFIMYYSIYASQKEILKLEKSTKKIYNEGSFITMLLGFPFYFLTYFLNQSKFKKSNL